MKFGSVCSGIEAASVAWEPLGLQAAWFVEIEPFPCAVLAHRFPSVPNLGDMTTIRARIESGEIEAPEVFTGGTPCQAFSVAGQRKGMNDERGQLSLEFCRIADAIDQQRISRGDEPAIIIWENVPGVLTHPENPFGCFLAELAGESDAILPPGGKWEPAGYLVGQTRTVAWRTFDAQFLGVAQRRKRIWLVASAGSLDPREILLEWESSRRDTPPSREARQGASRGAEIGPSGGRETEVSPTLDTRAKDGPIRNQLAPCAISFHPSQDPISNIELCHAISSGSSRGQASAAVVTQARVRRLTPRECERLQGFPDDWTLVPHRGKPAADGPRYKATGNSWAVPNARWIMRRILREIVIRAAVEWIRTMHQAGAKGWKINGESIRCCAGSTKAFGAVFSWKYDPMTRDAILDYLDQVNVTYTEEETP